MMTSNSPYLSTDTFLTSSRTNSTPDSRRASLAKFALARLASRASIPTTLAPWSAHSIEYWPSRQARSSTRHVSSGLGHEVVDRLQDPLEPRMRLSLVPACPEAMRKRDVVGPLPVPGDYVGVPSLELFPRH